MGCLSPEFYRHWMLQSQSTCLFSVLLCPFHNGSNFPEQLAGCNVLHSTPIPEDSDVVNFEQIGVVCRCTGHEFLTKLPKRYVEAFHHSFVINTVHNVPGNPNGVAVSSDAFVRVIIRIISRLRAAVFQNCTHRNRCRCFA